MAASTAVRIIGPGRAGTALALALGDRGWDVKPTLGRSDDISGASDGVDLLIIATPDDAIGYVARQVRPRDSAVVAHLSGALGLSALAPHPRRAALHPLVSMPTAEVGAERLVGACFATTGDPLAGEVVAALDGRAITVADDQRAAYHAAACIAANHMVALMGQVERIGDQAGVPFDIYVELARAALDSVAAVGPADALTGPVARGDEATVRRHLRAIPADERRAYRAMAERAGFLARSRRAAEAKEEE